MGDFDIMNLLSNPLQNMNETHHWENRPFIGALPEPKPYNNGPEIKRTIKKRVKRHRTAFTPTQLSTLERLYNQNKYISTTHRQEVAQDLNLKDRSVKVWFQNRRMKEKRDSSESSRNDSDSSSESTYFSAKSSPVSATTTESDSCSPKVTSTADVEIPVSFQPYQAPQFYPNIYEPQKPNENAGCYSTSQNGMQFYNDNNLYPTQYYPNNGNNYLNYEYNNYQQPEGNLMFANYWNFSNFASSNYYNEGVQF